MEPAQIEQILENGEGALVEFKQSASASLAKEMVAFANTAGGTIYIGISDDNRVIGCPMTNRMRSEIHNLGNNCSPRITPVIESFTYKGKEVVAIEIPESQDKPVQCSDGFFIREGANSQKMSRDEILLFAQKAGKIRFESQLRTDFKYPDDFDSKKFEAFLERSEIRQKTAREDVLENLGFGKQNGRFIINNAGVLFFANRREYYLRQAYVTCVLYKGMTKTKIIDRKDFRDDPVTDYENAFKFLQQHLRLEYRMKGGGPREEIPEIPYEALKEALLNAIIHRDYLEEGARVMVEIFDDRVEISNPGKLLFEKEKFGHASVARNPVIFEMFFRLNLVEKVGSGINRIRDLVEESGLSVKFDTDGYFFAIFQRPKITEVTTGTPASITIETLKAELTHNEIRVLQFCSRAPRSSREIADDLGQKRLSGPAQKSIKKLLSKKYLEHTIPETPNVPGQKYITSEVIKKLLSD